MSLVVKLAGRFAQSNMLVTIVVLLSVAFAASWRPCVRGLTSPEYENYVHTYLEPEGNWTFMEKPMFPILFNESQIGTGQNWSVVCPLEANHKYHAYCYGAWVNNGSEPKTDYDLYVYNPLGELESYHTESAGLPEHLGTTPDDPFFAARYSGNYTFVIRNDPRESNGTQQATFMIIENVECNVWNEHYIEGKDGNDVPVWNTSWAYEFVTDRQHVEIWVKVPETLDMYEVRLYLMSDPKMKNYTVLNGVPLSSEPGLYGEKSATDGGYKYGGYNVESQEYRGVAFASCESYGQEMFLNWSSPHSGKSLYHLVLIGEAGNGSVEFLVKTEFGNACLKPSVLPNMAYPQNESVVAYVSNATDLLNATLQYSTDGWANVTSVPMYIADNRTCNATISGQNAGTLVVYRVKAYDVFKNVLEADSNFSVKHPTTLNLTLLHEIIHVGENITVMGDLTPGTEEVPVSVVFNSGNDTKEIPVLTFSNGTFVASFQVQKVGMWEVQAKFDGDDFHFPSSSSSLTVKVEEPTFMMKYSLYIGVGVAAAAIGSVFVYLKKFKD